MGLDNDQSMLVVNSVYRYESRHLLRPKLESYRAGAFRVVLDGKDEGFLPSLATRTFGVEPGTHQLRMKFHWYRSKKVTFEIGASQRIAFEVSIPRTLATALKLVFRPRRSLTLRQTTA